MLKSFVRYQALSEYDSINVMGLGTQMLSGAERKALEERI